MAGDAWVMDIIWHTLIIATKWVYNFWTEWSMELLLGASFMAQLVLSLYAGSRWRGASKMVRSVIWVLYVAADDVATAALGHLSISGMSSERQLVAFWAPFFLLHLGGPDNITAYEFEDNQLSMRSVLQFAARVLGVVIVVYNSVSESWALILAAWSMLLVCVTKNVERILALQCANLGNIRRSLKLYKGQQRQNHRNLTLAAADDTGLLMRAHSLFHICKHAMVESWVEEELDKDEAAQTRKELFDLKSSQLLTVMEMELSLMYDFLYTKASVIYTWHGYAIRALSPLAVVGALVLVEMSNQGGRHKLSDVVITRALLVATFIMEMVSLLRALGSSWTGFLICTRIRSAWIHHQFFCNSRWHRFRHALASVGLLASVKDGDEEEEHRVNHHRRWSGNIGQLNLFERVTSGQLEKEQASFWVGREDKIKQCVQLELYTKVRHKVRKFRDELKDKLANKVHLAAQFRAKRGQKTLRDYGLHDDLRKSLGNELQVGILTWHIGTNIFLSISGKDKATDQVARGKGKDTEAQQVEAIRTLSNYMVYLLGERPHMLPGLVTRQLLEQTRRDLVNIWKDAAIKVGETASAREERLAEILQSSNPEKFDSGKINTYLSEGIELGKNLIDKDKKVGGFSKEKEKEKDKGKGIVEVILEVWVDMLFYASYRCSKESHAKQLAYGGELTTIVWLLAEHAGLFVVPKHVKKQGNKTSPDPAHTQTSTGNTKSSEKTTIQLVTEQAAHGKVQTSSWNGGGEVMIQLHPLGFSSGAYDLHTHDYFHQNYL